jgi:hypothetical protein
MKWILFLVSFLAFTPIYTYGDFVPGRVRASAKAFLDRRQGDGRYQDVRKAQIVQLKTDGAGITGFAVSFDRDSDLPFRVLSVKRNRCGRTYVAAFSDQENASELRIEEASAEGCLKGGKVFWQVTITTTESDRSASHLSLDGFPKFFLLTQ